MPDQTRSEKSIFLRAIEMTSPTGRAAFLEQACEGNPTLRAEVEALLCAHETPQRILDAPGAITPTTDHDTQPERVGTEIGRYKLMEQIGEGGMGLVFVAEQQQPVRRKVALKVIKPGMDTRQVVARFEAERQALALMDHPHIAKVLDGGQTAGGRPYFVMELVKGVPITACCDQNHMPIHQRLELFIEVCQAVQHAHQKGIIHRDLKPSNVLVMSHDGTPVVKVIDFGVAKAIGQELTDKTIYTLFSQLIGTPLYMSPEQAGQSGLDVDTRSDIYSLGVLLYELLTGTTPFDKQRMRTVSYDEMQRIIREEEPPKPSTRISTLGQAAPTVSMQRQSDWKQLSRLFRGELDWIVMKALEKDRDWRYETANGFAADVKRYLHDEPVLACPPSQLYRLCKFVRRNKTALAVVGLVVLFIILLGSGSGWVMRDRIARHQALDHEVNSALEEAEALTEKQKWTDALTIVQRTEALLQAAGRTQLPQALVEMRKDVEMAIQLEMIYGEPKSEEFWTGRDQDDSYNQAFQEYGIDVSLLSLDEAAERIRTSKIRQVLARGLDFWAHMRKMVGAKKPPTWQQLLQLAEAADDDLRRNEVRHAFRNEDSKKLERLAAAADIRHLPADTLVLLGRSLVLYADDPSAPKSGEALLRRAQIVHPADLWINDTLGLLCLRTRQFDDAARFYQTTVALRPNNPFMLSQLAWALARKGAREEAVSMISSPIEWEPSDPQAWRRRADFYLEFGEWEKAIGDYTRVLEMDPKNSGAWNNRGVTHRRMGQYQKAIADYTRAIELDPKTSGLWNNRGHAYSPLLQWDKARADYSRAIELNPRDGQVWFRRGNMNRQLGKWDKALDDYTKAIELDPRNSDAWNNRGGIYRTRRQYREAIADYTKAIEAGSKYSRAWYNRGLVYAEMRRFKEAIADYSKAIEIEPKYFSALYNRGTTYSELGEHSKAIADYSRAIELEPKSSWVPNLKRFRAEAEKQLDMKENK